MNKVKLRKADQLARDAFEHLSGIYYAHDHDGMLEAGEYIIKQFYNNNYELARSNTPYKNDDFKSLNKMIDANSDSNIKSFSKSWLYNSVNYTCEEEKYSSFDAYGKLGKSHKVMLFSIKDDNLKKELIEEIAANNYSVRRLRERLNALNNNKKTATKLTDIQETDFTSMDIKELKKFKKQAKMKLEKLLNETQKYERSLNGIEKALELKNVTEKHPNTTQQHIAA